MTGPRYLPPNWFAAVMGTGIVAVAATSLPVGAGAAAGLRPFALGVWLLAASALAVLVVATGWHVVAHPEVARTHLTHPVTSQFWGAPAMALLTVGAGTLLVGRDLLGPVLAVRVDAVLWVAGTVLGLVTAVVVPLRTHRLGRGRPAEAFGGWLMPVVPPMVSASTGALLVPYTPEGACRAALLVTSTGFFVLAAALSAPVIAQVARRVLWRHDVGEARMVPTLWIVLGPLGQSVTAAGLLAAATASVTGPHGEELARTVAVGYGLVVGALALAWAGVAAVVTVRTARRGLPFSLTWWSFTFPVGTCVTGADALAARTGWAVFTPLAVAGYAGLLIAWVVVASRTLAGLRTGALREVPAGLV